LVVDKFRDAARWLAAEFPLLRVTIISLPNTRRSVHAELFTMPVSEGVEGDMPMESE